ncbi:nucleotide sugar dehydrogenase [Priestia filamentosa]|uniref:nucleotide sugar dehydrogenase n=1 Tax=Priestia filamentosa TaxID=1402861 RepID=UPI003978B062
MDILNERIAIIGLGYVGLPLALLFNRKGFDVVGIDLDGEKVTALQENLSYLPTVKNEEIMSMKQSNRFKVTNQYSMIKELDVIIVCVPTPLKDETKPDLSYVKLAISSILPYLREGHMVILESSTYPGTTEELLKPLLEKSGFKVGKNVYLGFSPERIDPGNSYSLQSIPKIISGMTDECLQKIENIYSDVFESLVPVKSPKIAEMAKLLENTQRFINISFINDMARLCHHLGIDIWEVLQASSTKPFGFTPYSPGPGIGGHCIPVDPLYLKWKAEEEQVDTPFINLAKKIDDEQPLYISQRINELIKARGGISRKVIIIGVAYKKNINDVRESKAIPLIKQLHSIGYQVAYHDPFINEIIVDGQSYRSTCVNKDSLRQYDCAIIVTNHDSLDYETILKYAPVIFDTRNCFEEKHTHVHRL